MKQRLEDLASIRAGYQFRGRIEVVDGGDVRAIQVRDVDQYGAIAWENLVSTELKSSKQKSHKLTINKTPDWVQKGDVIFTARGPRNVAAVIDRHVPNLLCAEHFYVVRVHADIVLPAFVAWQLNQKPARHYFTVSAQGSDVQSIPRGILGAIALTIPPLTKQQQLVNMAQTGVTEIKMLHELAGNRQQLLDGIAQRVLGSD